MAAEVRAMSWRDTLRLQLHLTIPAFLLGVVVPNRAFLWLATRLGAGRPALRFLRELRDKYGCDRLWSRFPLRRTLLALSPEAIDAVLRSTANAPDQALKKRALSRFVPDALVISNRESARERRPFNTAALDLGRLHRHADAFGAIALDEAQRMSADRERVLRWADFQSLGERIAHQVILGRGRVEPELTAHLQRMLRRANLLLRHRSSYAAFYRALDGLLDGRGPVPSDACLMHEAAAAIADRSATASTCVPSQVAFWFFVLKDAVELHVARTLALIAAHPDVQVRVRDEVRAAGTADAAAIDRLQYVEACVAEGLRLWTPVPLLLRRAEQPFTLDGGIAIAEEDQLLVHAGFHHRDPRVFGESVETFSPDTVNGSPVRYVFSAYDRGCAGRSLVTFVLKATLAGLLSRCRFELVGPPVRPGRIPPLYDHFAIALRASPAA